MSVFFGFVVLAGLAAAVIGLALLIPRSSRRKGKRLAGIGGVVVVAAALLGGFSHDREMRALGWASGTDRDEALAAGFLEPAAWHAEQARLAEENRARNAALEAERKAENARKAASEAAAEEERETARLKAEAAEAAETESAAREAQEEAARKRAECIKDLNCIGKELSLSTASAACIEQVPKLAQYTFEWTDGLLEPKFSRFRWGNKKRTVVTILGDKGRAQNGFGAWLPTIYECDIEATTERIVDVRLARGRL